MLNNRWWISKTNVDILNKYYSKDVKSLGEEIVAKYLSSKNIQFIREHKFKNCRDILPLPFDFYIEKSNLIIEVDGVNHIQPVKDFGGDDGFKIIKKNMITLKMNIVNATTFI